MGRLRVTPYRRISDDREGREAGVTRQWDDMGKRASVEPTWSLVLDHGEPWTDNDISASSGAYRPAFEEIMSMVEAGQVDVVLAWTANRFLRSRRDRLRVIELFKATETRLIAINGPSYDYTTADGRLMADVIGAFDAGETERTAERVTRASRQRAENGQFHGGARPYGYGPIIPGQTNPKGNPARDWNAIIPEEEKVIKDVVERVIAGESLSSIATRLNKEGIKPARAKAWDRSSLRQMLRNPRLAGLRAYRGAELAKAQWPAIISIEEWRAVGAILADGNRRSSTGNQVKRLLAGHCYCSGCGARMYSRADSPSTQGIYYCPPLSQAGRPCSARVTMAIPLLDNLIIDLIAARLNSESLLSAVTGPVTSTAAEMAAVEARMATYTRDAADGKLEGDILYGLLAAGSRRLAELQDAQAREDRKRIVLPGPDAVEKWGSGDLTARRSILAMLVDGIIISPTTAARRAYPWERVHVVWRGEQGAE